MQTTFPDGQIRFSLVVERLLSVAVRAVVDLGLEAVVLLDLSRKQTKKERAWESRSGTKRDAVGATTDGSRRNRRVPRPFKGTNTKKGSGQKT